MSTPRASLTKLLPPWWPRYQRGAVGNDLIAGIVVGLMLIPQGLAYATLAGVPPQYGLYASILPLVLYALFGSSSVLAVGPVAITSLLTASALSSIPHLSVAEYVSAAALLTLLSGLMLLAAGFLRLGAIAQLLSHPVVSSFITGAAILIIISQIQPLLGLQVGGHSSLEKAWLIAQALPQTNPYELLLGGASLTLLLLARRYGTPLLEKAGAPVLIAQTLPRIAPMLLLLLGALLIFTLDWDKNVNVVGAFPVGIPDMGLPTLRLDWIQQLWVPALIIGLLGFIESIAIAQPFAQKERAPLDANAELRALGAANLGSALSQGFPVTGGFSRTLVNAEAGAKSPLAGVFTAGFILLSLWFATDLFIHLPITILAATIIVASAQLLDLKAFRQAWRYDRAEAAAMLGTTAGVLALGIEVGIGIGVTLSLMTLVWRLSRPHIAVVGLVPGTEHFRNITRHQVQAHPAVLMVRVDENLFFANAEAVARQLVSMLRTHPETTDMVLLMSSVSRVDVTALDMLIHLNEDLKAQRVRLHLAEVKGPVQDQLDDSELPARLSGRIFLTAFQAWQTLASPQT